MKELEKAYANDPLQYKFQQWWAAVGRHLRWSDSHCDPNTYVQRVAFSAWLASQESNDPSV